MSLKVSLLQRPILLKLFFISLWIIFLTSCERTGGQYAFQPGNFEIKVINQLNVNNESCTNHFHQWAMVEAIRGDQSGAEAILAELRKRRDATLEGLNSIDGIDIVTPESTFYLFPNVTRIMEKKGLSSVADLQVGALHNSGVSFAYSGINVEDIHEGMVKLKAYFENS